MSMDKLQVFKDFPADPKLALMVLWIKDKIWAPISRRINWLLDRIKDDTVEIVAAESEPEDNGNWRLYISGTDLLIQRKESGTWTTKSTISA